MPRDNILFTYSSQNFVSKNKVFSCKSYLFFEIWNIGICFLHDLNTFFILYPKDDVVKIQVNYPNYVPTLELPSM